MEAEGFGGIVCLSFLGIFHKSLLLLLANETKISGGCLGHIIIGGLNNYIYIPKYIPKYKYTYRYMGLVIYLVNSNGSDHN